MGLSNDVTALGVDIEGLKASRDHYRSLCLDLLQALPRW